LQEKRSPEVPRALESLDTLLESLLKVVEELEQRTVCIRAPSPPTTQDVKPSHRYVSPLACGLAGYIERAGHIQGLVGNILNTLEV